jgi:peptidoglycan/LPS O-acetylase OafA/YrhL
VDVFFLISGFIVYLAARRVIHAGKGVRLFLLKRFLRIFLPYWPIALALAAAYALLPGLSAAADPIQVNWLKSLTLIPGGDYSLSVAWTLSFELFFLRSVRGFSRLPPACLALGFDLDSFRVGANTGFSYA